MGSCKAIHCRAGKNKEKIIDSILDTGKEPVGDLLRSYHQVP